MDKDSLLAEGRLYRQATVSLVFPHFKSIASISRHLGTVIDFIKMASTLSPFRDSLRNSCLGVYVCNVHFDGT